MCYSIHSVVRVCLTQLCMMSNLDARKNMQLSGGKMDVMRDTIGSRECRRSAL